MIGRCEPGSTRIAALSADTSFTQNHSASRSRRGVASQSAVLICRSMWAPLAQAWRCASGGA